MNSTDINIFKRGFKRTMFALLTATLFVLAACGFVATAFVTGYLAVVTFIASLVFLGGSVFCVYCQGVSHKMNGESQGDFE